MSQRLETRLSEKLAILGFTAILVRYALPTPRDMCEQPEHSRPSGQGLGTSSLSRPWRARRRAGSGSGTALMSFLVYGCCGFSSTAARGPDLDDLAQIHDGHAVADALHHGDVVADEEIGEPQFLLQVQHQVDDLRLDRDVERRHGLVGDDQLRRQRQGACDAQSLPLAAREFMREARCHVGRETDLAQKLGHAARALALRRTGRARPSARRWRRRRSCAD